VEYVPRAEWLFGWNFCVCEASVFWMEYSQKFHAQDICKRRVCTTTTTAHNTQHNTSSWTMAAAAASSNISGPTAPTLPTAWSLIDYAIGYKDMQQLSTMEQYLQSYGQARFGG